MRELDRAGVLDMGEHGIMGLAALVALPLDVVEVGMAWWVKCGTFEVAGDGQLVMPNFLDAQEAVKSDAQRAREHRERARDRVRSGGAIVTGRDAPVTNRDEAVTKSDGPVTDRHAPSRAVTPNRTVPCLPCRTEPAEPAEPSLPLTLTPEAPKVKAKRATKPKPEVPGHADVIACFVEEYEKARHEKPIIDGKQGTGAKNLLTATKSADAAIAVIRRAFAEDPFVRTTKPDLQYIAGNINAYLGTAPPKTNGKPAPLVQRSNYLEDENARRRAAGEDELQ